MVEICPTKTICVFTLFKKQNDDWNLIRIRIKRKIVQSSTENKTNESVRMTHIH